VGGSVTLSPGDTARFSPPNPSVQYHFAVPDPDVFVDIWRGQFAKGHGVARSKPGTGYCDHVCGAGSFVVTLDGATVDQILTVTANSWLKKVFGW
jgi:hypothetical protein